MTTVLAVHNSEGCVGSCDARCHDAKGKSCHCICGGQNHGVGYMKAALNVADRIGLQPEDLIAFAKAINRDPRELTVVNRLEYPQARAARKRAHDKLTQPDLFEPFDVRGT